MRLTQRDFRNARSLFPCQADNAGSNRETSSACDGFREATADSEKGLPSTPQTKAAMGKFNDALRKAGILRMAEGLKVSSRGKRVAFDGAGRRVSDGPFAHPRELLAASNCGTSRTWTRRLPG